MANRHPLRSYVFSGLDGTLMTKRSVPTDSLSVCSTAMLNVRGGHSVEAAGMGALANHPDAILVPESSHYGHWRNDTVVHFCDVLTDSLEDHPICLRRPLKALDALLLSNDVEVKFGVEIEFTAAPQISPDTMDQMPNASTDLGMYRGSSRKVEEVLDRVFSVGERMGISWYSGSREYHPSQFEVSIGPVSAIKLAEQFLLAKAVIESEFSRIGWETSFLPLTINGGPGNGCHFHVSVAHKQDNNLLVGKLAPMIASDLKQCAAFFNSSVNSFRRLMLDEFQNLEDIGDNRHCLVRVVNSEPSRLELRTPDSMMNVYAALQKILLSVKSTFLASEKDDEDAGPFPESLEAATRNLSQAIGIRSHIGDVFCDAFQSMLEHQNKIYHQTVSPIDYLLLEPQNYNPIQNKRKKDGER